MILPKKIGDAFANWIDTPMFVNASMTTEAWKWIRGGERQRPEEEIPIVALTKESFSNPPSQELTVRWLGHSSLLIEMNGLRLLIDPVLDSYASPVPGFAKRFSKSPVRLEDMPKIDAVILSHDHYDHLEKKTVRALAKTGTRFFASLGVGAHLRGWAIPKEQVSELNWWEQVEFESLTVVCVPARHFSGRGLFDRNRTLWSAWVIKGSSNIFFSGDSGYAGHFKAIGEQLGPFDITVIKIGAYNDKWPFIHLTPEQAVQAHKDLGGRVFLPVHWGTFVLSLHPWDEPIRRAVKAAAQERVDIATPMIGQLVELDKSIPGSRWWESVK